MHGYCRPARFERDALAALTGAEIASLARSARRSDAGAIRRLAAQFAHAALVAPETAFATYEIFSAAWLAQPAEIAAPPAVAPMHPDAAFWNAFWAVIDDAVARRLDAGSITARVAGMGVFLPDGFRERAEDVARTHPRAKAPEMRAMPKRLSLDELAKQPEGSLGHSIYRLIVDNKFDLEVLDREAIGLAALPPALRFLNTRILQMHDVWHLVAGYRTTALHEIGISAFQLAQFGHGYSAMLLASVTTVAALGAPMAATLFLQTIAEAWQHGRRTPAFMDIAWENAWSDSIEAIRAQHAIEPFAGSLPADLLEQGLAA